MEIKSIDGQVEKAIQTKDAEYIYLFAKNVKNLSKENIDSLVNGIIQTKNAEYIYLFARDIKNLSKENIDSLTNEVIKQKDAWYIYLFAKNVKNLSKENIDSLTNWIIQAQDAEEISLFARNVEKLSKENIDKLEKTLFNSKNHLIIASYLLFKKDPELIKKIFGSLDKFFEYCNSFKGKLGLTNEDIQQLYCELRFKYVDDNIDKYLNKKTLIKSENPNIKHN